MVELRVYLLGKFRVTNNNKPLPGLEIKKVQELLGYLLLNLSQHHHREKIATLLWSNCATQQQARGYLRKSIWQLQKALNSTVLAPALSVDSEWIALDKPAGCWLDTAALEEQFTILQTERQPTLGPQQAQLLKQIVAACHGELLEGRYYDWCIAERERFKLMLLIILDALTIHFEQLQQYETGCLYALRILQHDPAREHTHRRLMRMLYKSGDRSGAIRQFQQCQTTLAQELAVNPAPRTLALFERIKVGGPLVESLSTPASPQQAQLQQQLCSLRASLTAVQQEIDDSLQQLSDGCA